MSRAPRDPPSASAGVPALLRYLAQRGHATAELCERFALPPETAELAEVTTAPEVFGELLATASTLLAEPFLALRLPGELPLLDYEVAELALRASPTLRDGLRTAARHAARIHPHLELELREPAHGDAVWIQRTPRHPRGIGRHVHEYGLAYVLVHAHAGLGSPLRVRHAWFAHARPRGALDPIERAFGTTDLVFGAPDSGFQLAPALLDQPLHGDRRLLATVAALAAARPPAPRDTTLAQRVAAHLRAHLTDSATEVAAALRVSARTLQRRLELEGTTFTGVVDETRESLARELLADPALPLAEIGYRLGFSDLATFSRAFKRWTGKPPGLFRRS